LIQSKNPRIFKFFNIPSNVIIGTTLETDRDDLYKGISKAPLPSLRYMYFLDLTYPRKMVTVEPVIDFNLDVLLDWILNIKPCMVWLGYDSKKNYLPEPELEKVKHLHWKLSKEGFTVILKTIRKAWWE